MEGLRIFATVQKFFYFLYFQRPIFFIYINKRKSYIYIYIYIYIYNIKTKIIKEQATVRTIYEQCTLRNLPNFYTLAYAPKIKQKLAKINTRKF